MARQRKAFTLVELLVVMTIIGMLMALLLPAVQSAREAGRRTACTSNLYMLALAAIRFDEQSGFLPGWRNRGPQPGNSEAVSWPIMLMPNMERNDIYQNISTGGNQAPYISFLVCPTSPPDTLTDSTISYAGNIGSAFQRTPSTNRWDGVMHDTTSANGPNTARIGLDDISSADGTPQTLFLTERCGRMIGQARWSERFERVNDPVTGLTTNRIFGNGPTSVAGVGIHGNVAVSYKVINNITNGNIPGFRSQPSSNHPGGVVAAFCDGHTAFLKDSMNRDVYANVLNWNLMERSVNPGRNWLPINSPFLILSDQHLQ